MKPSPSSDYDEKDREIIQLLEELGSFKSAYPAELLRARRETFLAQVEGLSTADIEEGLSPEDQEFVKLLGNLKSVPFEYPPDLLAARRSALLRQLEMPTGASVWDQFRGAAKKIFPSKRTIPTAMRISLAIGSLLAAVWIGSLFFSRAEGSLQPSPSQVVLEPTHLPTSTAEVAITICKPGDQAHLCPPGELDPNQDLADSKNGLARPAVSKDARSYQDRVHAAAYVNDGQGGASWVSNSADSWIKIDLGKVTTINTISLQKGSAASSDEDNPGQFVIAVALSDVYADGDSSHDYAEYAQVFHSEQTDFSGTLSSTETIRTQFPAVQARFVKITFEKAGTAIEEVGVFLVRPSVPTEEPMRKPQDDLPGLTLTPAHTSSPMDTATLTPTGTQLPTDTAVPALTNTPVPSATPSRLPTNTQPPADPATLVPTLPLPSNTPIPLPTLGAPTEIPPTAVSTDPIRVTGSNQSLTFTCNGNAAEISGHANTITLLGSCSSITVTGNGNHVFWQFGSPIITIKGKDNIVQQL